MSLSCLQLSLYFVTVQSQAKFHKMREISIFQLYRFNKYETILLHI